MSNATNIYWRKAIKGAALLLPALLLAACNSDRDVQLADQVAAAEAAAARAERAQAAAESAVRALNASVPPAEDGNAAADNKDSESGRDAGDAEAFGNVFITPPAQQQQRDPSQVVHLTPNG